MLACLLGILTAALTASCSDGRRHLERLTKAAQADRHELLLAHQEMAKMSHLDAMQRVMRTYGAGPFMMSVADRLAADTQELAKNLGISPKEAVPIMIAFLNGQQPELRPSERPPVGS